MAKTNAKKGVGCIQMAVLVLGGFFSLIFLFFGVLFIWSAGAAGVDSGARLTTGVILIVVGLVFIGITIGIAIFIYRRLHPSEKKVEITQKIDLSGDVEMESLKCQKCGAELDKDSITLKEGAIIVSCPYCGSNYEIEEAPKW
jgi:DNA-directed RNA polymerase subunit RPC12/RpoP